MCGAETHSEGKGGGVLEIGYLIILYLYMNEHIHTLHQQRTSANSCRVDKKAAVTRKNQNDVTLMDRH